MKTGTPAPIAPHGVGSVRRIVETSPGIPSSNASYRLVRVYETSGQVKGVCGPKRLCESPRASSTYGAGRHRGKAPTRGKFRGFGLTPDTQACIIHTEHTPIVNAAHTTADSQSERRVMGRDMHTVAGQRGAGKVPGRVRSSGMPSCAQNGPNLSRSLAQNADFARERTQSKPILTQQNLRERSRRLHCHQSRQTKPISAFLGQKRGAGEKTKPIRPAPHGQGRSRPRNPKHETRSSKHGRNPKYPNDRNAPNKANSLGFWADNAGRARKQSQTKPIGERNAEKKIKHQESKIKIAESPRRDDDFVHLAFRTLHFALLREQRLAFRASRDRFQGPESGFWHFLLVQRQPMRSNRACANVGRKTTTDTDLR